MRTMMDIAVHNIPPTSLVERRRQPRIHKPYLTRARGTTKGGDTFTVDTVLDDIGAEGFYLRLPHEVEQGDVLRAIVRFTTSEAQAAPAPRLLLKGRVLRVEPQPDGKCGVAVRVQRYRFLSPK